MPVQIPLPLYSIPAQAERSPLRRPDAETHCRQGHEYAVTGVYTYYNPNGTLRSRQCKPCTIARVRASRLLWKRLTA